MQNATFTTQLFWRFENAPFSEEQSVYRTWAMGPECKRYRIELPLLKAAPAQLRLDLTDRPAVLMLNSITVLDDRAEPIWSLDLDKTRDLTMSGMSMTPVPPNRALVTIRGSDPSILLPLSRTVLDGIRSGSILEIEMGIGITEGTVPVAATGSNTDDAGTKYHEWYYDTEVWKKVTFLGVPCYKSVGDLWSYQEILTELRPQLVIEFGTLMGGSTLYFAEILNLVSPGGRVLSVDIKHTAVFDCVRRHPAIELLEADTLSSAVFARITELREQHPGPAFWIIDDDHRKEHVLAELKQMRDFTLPGDYVVVEDGNVNGHPILPGWGPGPYEAISAYFEEFPDDYRQDAKREQKFGFTFAPSGFLIRR